MDKVQKYNSFNEFNGMIFRFVGYCYYATAGVTEIQIRWEDYHCHEGR
jgi:hypothetical protein